MEKQEIISIEDNTSVRLQTIYIQIYTSRKDNSISSIQILFIHDTQTIKLLQLYKK